MEIVGIGTDIVELARVQKAQYLDRVAEFFLTESELADMRSSRDMVQFVASRLAAKEAVLKACPERLWYHDFSLVKKDDKLVVVVHAPLAKKYRIVVSIAHEFSYTVSTAIASL